VSRVLDQAIIISGRDYRENDRLVRLFTLGHGPLTALARGAKRSLKRFCGTLEPCSRIGVELAVPEEGLAILYSAEIIASHPALRRELERFAHASYACELADRFLAEHLPNPRLFRLLAMYLEFLGQAAPGSEDPVADARHGGHVLGSGRRFYEINLLNILGYRPDLSSPLATGMLSPLTAQLLQQCQASGRFGAVTFSPHELAEAGSLLDRTLASHLDRPLKSLEFMREVCIM
jgi:DNA repair protein RecO (recombination protein O)